VHNRGPPNTYRIALSPFGGSNQSIPSLIRSLTSNGLLPEQFCLVGIPSAIAPLASSIDPSSAIYPTLLRLVTNLTPVHAPKVSVPLLASVGPINDVLLKKQSWLSSPAAATLMPHLEKGDPVLAVNAFDHDQFVNAANLLLRRGTGNVLTNIFAWPTTTTRP
jgi:hypothetical protein